MPKRYIVEAADGTSVTSATTSSSGSLVHFIDAGPTLGRIRAYSGVVNGTTYFYWADDGPTLGEERTTT
jgi:hypothetical protein